jgi:hypothetical protein
MTHIPVIASERSERGNLFLPIETAKFILANNKDKKGNDRSAHKLLCVGEEI